MDFIFHEKQEGQLCAKHCLNSLLQGPYFTEIDLASIAKMVDEEEKKKMAEGGENREGYLQFIASPSSNMDDSGYFSIQVIASALRVWNLDLIPFKSKNQIAVEARTDPTSQKCYICNYRDHWFAIRKIGHHWYNLNSLLSSPEPISDTYLSLFLAQLMDEGYSIFIVYGDLPSLREHGLASESDPTNSKKRQEQAKASSESPKKSTALTEKFPDLSKFTEEDDEDASLQRAIQASLQADIDEETKQIQEAIAMSLEQS